MTTSVKDYLVAEVRRLATQAKSIADKAELEGRALTRDEHSQVEAILATVKSKKVEIQGMTDREALLKAIGDNFDGIGEPRSDPAASAKAQSLGDAFVGSQAYKALKDRGLAGRWTTGPIEFGVKLTDGGSPAVNVEISPVGTPLNPQVALPGPLSPQGEERLDVAALFGQGVATQNSIVYLEETTTNTLLGQNPYSGSSSSDVHIDQGTTKPAVFVDFTKRTTSIEKIAAFMPVADEMLEDEPQIASYINGRLTIFVRQAEEAYLMNKVLAAVAANSSIAQASDVGTAGNLFDAVAAGILKCQTAGGLEPDAVLINPTDFWKMATSKAGTTGEYFSGGPYASPLRNPWGITAVVTRAALINKPLVGAFREGATLWRKGGLSVEASNSHADYFRKDLTALRAEERIGLTVFRPKAFVLVTA